MGELGQRHDLGCVGDGSEVALPDPPLGLVDVGDGVVVDCRETDHSLVWCCFRKGGGRNRDPLCRFWRFRRAFSFQIDNDVPVRNCGAGLASDDFTCTLFVGELN